MDKNIEAHLSDIMLSLISFFWKNDWAARNPQK